MVRRVLSKAKSQMKVCVATIFMLSALSACALVNTSSVEKSAESDIYEAQIGIVNHTDQLVYSASVKGNGGGHASAYSAGIANICCVTLPLKWYPGLKIEVSWDMPIGRQHVYKSKNVEVEKYDTPGSLYLHFFANDEVRIVVTNWVGSSLQHPIAPPPRRLRDQSHESPTHEWAM